VWANKKFLVNISEAEEDGVLHLINGDIPVLKGNIVAHSQSGETLVMPRDYFERNYVEVEKVKKPKIDIEQMAENYAQDWSNFDDEEYIERFQETVRNRNNNN
jgi:hypothetical protein